MKNSYRILLVSEDPGDEKSVREKLRECDGPVFALEHAGSFIECLDCIGEKQFDAILMGVALPDSRGLQALTTVRVYSPTTPILVWTSVDNPQMARGAMQAGAQDYLLKDRLTGQALVRALHYAIIRQSGNPSVAYQSESFSVGVLGVKGGVGTTTIACHLAAELRRSSRNPVLLADLDLYGGQAAFLMQACSLYSMLDAANNLHHLDDSYCAALLADGIEDVSVIRSPGLSAMADLPAPGRFRHVLRFLRTRFPWVVADLGRLNPISMPITRDLAYLLLVTTSDPQALLETRAVLMELASSGFPRDRVRLVINRLREDADVIQSEAHRLVGVPVYALPDKYEALANACGNRHLLPAGNPLRQEIARIAASLCGIEQPQREENPLFQFFRDRTSALLQRRRPYVPIPLQLPAPSTES